MLNVPQSANINDLPLERGPIIGSERKRTAIIIGAGVVGMATAYALAQRDIRVTVIEGQESPDWEPLSPMERSSAMPIPMRSPARPF